MILIGMAAICLFLVSPVTCSAQQPPPPGFGLMPAYPIYPVRIQVIGSRGEEIILKVMPDGRVEGDVVSAQRLMINNPMQWSPEDAIIIALAVRQEILTRKLEEIFKDFR